MRSVIVVRALPGLGDFLCAVPALRALRAAAPDAQITLLGLAANRPLVDRFAGYVDELLELPGYPGLPEQPVDVRVIPGFLAGVQQRGADLVLQLHGSGVVTNGLAVLLGGRVTAGTYLPGQWCPDERTFLPYQEGESEVTRPLRVLEHVGIPSRGTALEFPRRDEDDAALHDLFRRMRLKRGEYVCIHPGSSNRAKRWPADDFLAVGRALAAQGLRVAVTGVAGEAELTARVARGIGRAAVDLAGACALGTTAALLAESRLLVCNDTGVSHLAAALRVPSVVVMPWSDHSRWAPLDRTRHRGVPAPGRSTAGGDLRSEVTAAALELAEIREDAPGAASRSVAI